MFGLFGSWKTATVKAWKGGYGFLTRGEGTEDIFAHKTVLPKGVKNLEPGTKVKFKEGKRGEKGPTAKKIKLA